MNHNMEVYTIKNVKTIKLVEVLKDHPDWTPLIDTYWTHKTKEGLTHVETFSKEVYNNLLKKLK